MACGTPVVGSEFLVVPGGLRLRDGKVSVFFGARTAWMGEGARGIGQL